MVAYLVNQIKLGKLTYQEIITAKPDLQVNIDAYIEAKGIVIDKAV